MAKKPPYPFIKWAGGKSRVAPRVQARLPSTIKTYYEPFLGGGAVFIELAKARRFRKAVLSDLHPELVNVWKMVQLSVDALVRELKKPKYFYEKSTFLRIRELIPSDLDDVERAARFIYLNKTCFNGLYRVNKSGQFNVPFGSYTDPVICDEANLRAVSELLQGVSIMCADFNSCSRARPGDAVYFDPPYLPISKTSSFTSYTESGFGLEQHEQLAKLFAKLGQKGVRCVLSNSVAEDAKRLYAGFDTDWFTGTRSVGGPADFRKPAGEMIVFNGPRIHAQEAG